MAKLTVHPAGRAPAAKPPRPSARAAAPTTPEAVPPSDPDAFEDSLGRVIRVRKLTALQMMRLMRNVGEENDRYFDLCTDVASVSEIDGRSFSFPESRMDLEHVVQLLAVEGLSALMAHLYPKAATEGMPSVG